MGPKVRARARCPGTASGRSVRSGVEPEERKSLEVRTEARGTGGPGGPVHSLRTFASVRSPPRPSGKGRREGAPVLVFQPFSPSLLRPLPHWVLVWGGVLQTGLVGSLPGTCKPPAVRPGA